jgi:hypothetical protein
VTKRFAIPFVLFVQSLAFVATSAACPPGGGSPGRSATVRCVRTVATAPSIRPSVAARPPMEFVGYAVCVKDRFGTLWLAELLGDRRTAEELVAALRGRGMTAWTAEYHAPRSTSFATNDGRNAVGIAVQRGSGGAKAFAVRNDRRVESLASIP